MKKIIFACVQNAGRSQMAAAFFNTLCDSEKAYAISAGTNPASAVHPTVIEVMKEIGIDLSQSKPRRLSEEMCKDAALLITMGCGENCPYVPDLEVRDWPLPDLAGQDIGKVRLIRDEIKSLVKMLVIRT